MPHSFTQEWLQKQHTPNTRYKHCGAILQLHSMQMTLFTWECSGGLGVNLQKSALMLLDYCFMRFELRDDKPERQLGELQRREHHTIARVQ